MKYAKTLKGRVVFIEAAKVGGQLFCPICQKAVTVRAGKYQKKHFAHKNKITKKNHDFSEHLQLQKQIYQSLTGVGIKVELEYKTAGGNRADIYTEFGNRKVIIEVQRTAISFERVQKRILSYKNSGHEVLWLIPFELITNQTSVLKLKIWVHYLIQLKQQLIFYSRKTNGLFYVHWSFVLSSQRLLFSAVALGDNIISLYKTEAEITLTDKEKRAKSNKISKKIAGNFSQWRKKYIITHKRDDILLKLAYTHQIELTRIPYKWIRISIPMHEFTKAHFWIQTLIAILFLYEHLEAVEIYQYCKKNDLTLLRCEAVFASLLLYCQHLEEISHSSHASVHVL
ncbi:MAG: competence protein CoiA [Culicoidibacterales bacterium]